MFVIRLPPNGRTLVANLACFAFLIVYTLFGGFVYLYLEHDHFLETKVQRGRERLECIQEMLEVDAAPEAIAERCLIELHKDTRKEWNLKNSLLFGFGILTTLGYGKIEPATLQAQLFAVIWGCLGVPVTVIILTNIGLYMRKAEKHSRRTWRHFCHWVEKRRRKGLRSLLTPRRNNNNINIEDGSDTTSSTTYYSNGSMDSAILEDLANNNLNAAGRLSNALRRKPSTGISPSYLATIVMAYLVVGALFIPLLNGRIELINGLYYSYLCFTAIEYGGMIPQESRFIPIVIVYMVVGLAMSTIALDIGSTYVKKLYYFGRAVKQIHLVRIWFGAKSLHVRELLTALGQTIGINPDSFNKLDLDKMVSDAIRVKEGKLTRVPQAFEFMEGIWPPELVPLFLKAGSFPTYADADERDKRTSICFCTGMLTTPKLTLSTYAGGHLNRTLHTSRQLLARGSPASSQSTPMGTPKRGARNNGDDNNN